MYKGDFNCGMFIEREGKSSPQTQMIKTNLIVMYFEALAKMVNGGGISSLRELRDSIAGPGVMLCLISEELCRMSKDMTLEELKDLTKKLVETVRKARDEIEKEIEEADGQNAGKA